MTKSETAVSQRRPPNFLHQSRERDPGIVRTTGGDVGRTVVTVGAVVGAALARSNDWNSEAIREDGKVGFVRINAVEVVVAAVPSPPPGRSDIGSKMGGWMIR